VAAAASRHSARGVPPMSPGRQRGDGSGDADDFSLAANAGQIQTCYDGEVAYWPVLERPTCPINFQVILPAILILSSTRPSNTHVQI
jgi:hypothetical protein